MEVIRCAECVHFDTTGLKNYNCKNLQGLNFPGPGDYCSKAEKREESIDLMGTLLEALKKDRLG